MKTIKFILILALVLNLTNCSYQSKTSALLNYSIIKDEVYDIPIKTQVQLDVLLSDTIITEQKVRELLSYLYDKTISRTGFKYHSYPTNIFIYVYSTKAKAESGMGQWIGMISTSFSEDRPAIYISNEQLNSLILKPIDKFGLSEVIRLEIWNNYIKLQDMAQMEADMKYPLTYSGIEMGNIDKNGDLYYKLQKKYKKQLATEFKIDIAIIDSIKVEGILKGWAIPPKNKHIPTL